MIHCSGSDLLFIAVRYTTHCFSHRWKGGHILWSVSLSARAMLDAGRDERSCFLIKDMGGILLIIIIKKIRRSSRLRGKYVPDTEAQKDYSEVV